MYKKLLFTFVLIFGSLITIYPSKKEDTNLLDYCYSFEKILSRNSIDKSKNLSKKFKPLVKDITLFGTNKTKGSLVNKIIDQYKTSKKLFLITLVPNQIYCLAGYWIEEVNPGTFKSILDEKSQQKINEYKDIKKEVDAFIKDISSEYKSIKKEINPKFEEISVQEAWIDDQTPEDICNFVEKLRIEGAYDVSYQAINMKKDRIGFSIQAILPIEKKELFRQLWFDYSNTIGVRERTQSRWILLRRRGECSTTFGKIKVKQTLKPDGSITIKPENDEVLRLKIEHKISTEEIRRIIKESA